LHEGPFGCLGQEVFQFRPPFHVKIDRMWPADSLSFGNPIDDLVRLISDLLAQLNGVSRETMRAGRVRIKHHRLTTATSQ
jgi:hypothetical protein